MASLNPPIEEKAELAPGRVAQIWRAHLMSLLIPSAALAYVWSGPHPWYIAPLFIVPFAIFQWIDVRPRYEMRQPVEPLPEAPFDALVYALTGIHFLILFGLVVLFSQQQVFSIDMVMIFVIVGGNSGFSIITAHELIHRKNKLDQTLGRLLLCTVLYEHFYTEHLRGHHVRVGTAADPATARFGERFEAFFRRTVPGQFKSAWRIESRRLGDESMRLWDRRMLQHRCLQGLVVEWSLVLAVGLIFGPVACLAYVFQAFMAVRLLEAVNYFEHWGLVRTGRRVRPADSWDTHSWFTYYGLIGLSRHADHHAYPSRPYQQLRVWEEAPVLPIGYVGLVDLVLTRNDEFIAMATKELEAKRLGPFAEEAPADSTEEDGSVESATGGEGAGAPSGRWTGSPSVWARRVFVGLAILSLSALGVAWESGGSVSVPLAFGQNALIFSIFGFVLWARSRMEQMVNNGWISWGFGLALLVVVGWMSTPWTT